MAAIPYIDVARIVSEAGFPGGGPQATGIAVISAESGRDPQAKNVVGNEPSTSVDRGLWQINDYWHPEVSDAVAYDAVLSTEEALRISKNGSDFGPWSAYNNGSYLKHMDAAKVALDGLARLRRLEDVIKNRELTIAALNAEVMQLKLALAVAQSESARLVIERDEYKKQLDASEAARLEAVAKAKALESQLTEAKHQFNSGWEAERVRIFGA